MENKYNVEIVSIYNTFGIIYCDLPEFLEVYKCDNNIIYDDEKKFIQILTDKIKKYQTNKSSIIIFENIIIGRPYNDTLFYNRYILTNNILYDCYDEDNNVDYLPPTSCAIETIDKIYKSFGRLHCIILPVNYKKIKNKIIKNLKNMDLNMKVKNKWVECHYDIVYKYKSEIILSYYNLDLLHKFLLNDIIKYIDDYVGEIYTFCFENHPSTYEQYLINDYLYMFPSPRKNTFFANKKTCVDKYPGRILADNVIQ